MTSQSPQLNKIEYASFLIIGISYLWPWNCFLSASPYFYIRFEGYPGLQASISSSLMAISTLTSTTIFILLVRSKRVANYAARVGFGELVIFSIFLVLAFSCILFTNVHPVAYYVFLLVSIFISTIGTSFAQNGSFATVNLFDPIYTQAIMVGQATAGILPPIVSITSAISAIGTEQVTADPTGKSSLARFCYFGVASTIAMLAFGLFSVVIKREPTRLHGETQILGGAEPTYQAISPDDENVPKHDDAIPSSPLQLFTKLKVPAATVFLVFSVTLAYPVVSQSVAPVHTPQDSILFNPKVFIPFALFIWNLGDFVGRLICGRSDWVVPGHRFLSYALARFAFLPAYFILCNVYGPGTGLIQSDVVYLLIHFLFGVTNGHLGSSAMMQAGSYVGPHEKEQAGSFMTMMLAFGLTTGALFSFALVALISA